MRIACPHTSDANAQCIAAVVCSNEPYTDFPQESVSGAFPRCSACERAESPSRPLYFTTLAQGGQVFLVCQHCFLCIQVREIGSGGDISNATLEEVRVSLLRIYELLRTELAIVYDSP